MTYSVFTFRTNPYIDQIRDAFGEPFIFGSLKKDLEIYKEQIKKSQPDYIIGLALSDKTYIEPVAVNRFHRSKKILHEGPEKVDLYTPLLPFPMRKYPTDSFCNYVAYQVACSQLSRTKVCFIHYRAEDFSDISELLISA